MDVVLNYCLHIVHCAVCALLFIHCVWIYPSSLFLFHVWLWTPNTVHTFLQFVDSVHQCIESTLCLQPVGRCGIGEHVLLFFQAVDLPQKLFLQLTQPALQEVAELTREGRARIVGTYLLLLKGRLDRCTVSISPAVLSVYGIAFLPTGQRAKIRIKSV